MGQNVFKISNNMRMYSIILFIVFQGISYVLHSQCIIGEFKISTVKSMTWFDDVRVSDFMGFPIINEKGEKIGNPSSVFCSKERLQEIERGLYTEEERNYMLELYKPRAIVIVRANDGKIVSVSFGFENLPDSSVIDTKKLQKMQKKIMTELSYENLLFNGQKAVSGYMLASIWFFRP